MKPSLLLLFAAVSMFADGVQTTTNDYAAWTAQASQFGPVISTNFPGGSVTIPGLAITSEAVNVLGSGPGLTTISDGLIAADVGYWSETLYSTTIQLLLPDGRNAPWHGMDLRDLATGPSVDGLSFYFETVTGHSYVETLRGDPDPFGGYTGYSAGDVAFFTDEQLDRVMITGLGDVYFQASGLAIADDAVPEPASVSLLLLGSALLILSLGRRRRLAV